MRKNTRKLSQVGRKQIVVHQQARTNLVGSFLTFGSFFRSHQFLVEFSPRTMIWFIFSVTSIFGRIFTPNHDLVHFFGTSIFGRIFTPSHHLVHVKLVHSKPQTIIWFMSNWFIVNPKPSFGSCHTWFNPLHFFTPKQFSLLIYPKSTFFSGRFYARKTRTF